MQTKLDINVNRGKTKFYEVLLIWLKTAEVNI